MRIPGITPSILLIPHSKCEEEDAIFKKMLESSEIRKLLIEKANVSRNPLRYSTSEMLEYYTLFATMSLTKS